MPEISLAGRLWFPVVNVPFKPWFYLERAIKVSLNPAFCIATCQKSLTLMSTDESPPRSWCPFPNSSRKRGSRPAPCSIMARAFSTRRFASASPACRAPARRCSLPR
ncbi:hypothetical protein BRAO375_950009 [Bradyrhizobium sp. ORS 375]|nr:hypothetical protein BRAO375_950009 [Bradyrhizobium sp. ORS 375]